jgi:hypothetical protein
MEKMKWCQILPSSYVLWLPGGIESDILNPTPEANELFGELEQRKLCFEELLAEIRTKAEK